MFNVESNRDEVAASHPPAAVQVTLQEIATDAIRYWEPRRLIYNAVLAFVVVGYFFNYWPESKRSLTIDNGLMFVVLGVLANLCYCTAYVVDVFAQYSDFRDSWRRRRWLFFAFGTTFAAILAHFSASSFFAAFIPG